MKSKIGKMVIYKPTKDEIEKQKKLQDNAFCNVQVELPAVIVKDWGGVVNLNVLMDGQGSFWSTSRPEGTGQGEYQLIDDTEPETEG